MTPNKTLVTDWFKKNTKIPPPPPPKKKEALSFQLSYKLTIK